MADEKSIVKMNKMIHKKTGASFLVVYQRRAIMTYNFGLSPENSKKNSGGYSHTCFNNNDVRPFPAYW